MKKGILVYWFCFGFIETYLFLSFSIPSLQIWLIADSFTYFIESLKATWVFKGIISLVVAILCSVISYIGLKKRFSKNNFRIAFLISLILFLLSVIGIIIKCDMI